MEMVDQALSNIPFLLFFVVGTIAVASSILVVAMRNPVHSALFLLLTFVCVAILFFLKHAEFVGAVQILVYAGGVMVLFLFVVMLINVRELPEERMLSPFWAGAIAVGVGVFILMGTVVRGGQYAEPVIDPDALKTTRVLVSRTATTGPDGQRREKLVYGQRPVGNSEAVGMLLYREYLVPFEVASVFLLVAMIGAIVIGKRELRAEEEEATQDFILRRAAEEKQVKESIGA
jgi:NADH-quinone oxidoreductase subunit J